MIDMDKVTAAWMADQATGAIAEWVTGYTDGQDDIGGQAFITHHTDDTYLVSDGSKCGPEKRFRVRVEVEEVADRPVIVAESGRLSVAPLDDPERFTDIGYTTEGVTLLPADGQIIARTNPTHTRAWARINDQGMVDLDAPFRRVDPVQFMTAWGAAITADVKRARKTRCVNDTDGDGDCAACARNPSAPCRRPLDERQPAGDLVERLATELHALWGTDFEDGSGDALEAAREILGRLGLLPAAHREEVVSKPGRLPWTTGLCVCGEPWPCPELTP